MPDTEPGGRVLSEALVEKAAEVIDARTGRHMGAESWRECARAVLAAVADDLRAEGAERALREAADEIEAALDRECQTYPGLADALLIVNDRADRIAAQRNGEAGTDG